MDVNAKDEVHQITFLQELIVFAFKYFTSSLTNLFLYQTPLHCASQICSSESVKVLIDNGADVNSKDQIYHFFFSKRFMMFANFI